MDFCVKCKKEITVHLKYGTGRFCSRSCANSHIRTDESKLRTSKKLQNNIPWNKGKKYRVFAERKCVQCNIIFIPKKDTQTYCSVKCVRLRPGQGGYRENSTRQHQSIYSGSRMHSRTEEKFAKLMDSHSIAWKKNNDVWYEYIDHKGNKRKYYPDFYLPEYDYWVEIKGMLYINSDDIKKLKSVGSNIELQLHTDIRLPKCVTT